jgi:hypothetical protein
MYELHFNSVFVYPLVWGCVSGVNDPKSLANSGKSFVMKLNMHSGALVAVTRHALVFYNDVHRS